MFETMCRVSLISFHHLFNPEFVVQMNSCDADITGVHRSEWNESCAVRMMLYLYNQ